MGTVITPVFFKDSIISERYVEQILWPFFEWLTDEECQYAFFQQFSTIAHAARASIFALREGLWDRIIISGLWAVCSPDLKPCDFHVWETVKQKNVQNTPSHNWRTEGKYLKESFLYFPRNSACECQLFMEVPGILAEQRRSFPAPAVISCVIFLIWLGCRFVGLDC
jgi:hypothetical protein